MDITREVIVAEARKWKDVKWRHEGRNENGIDCVGLAVVVAKGLDLFHYDVTGYTRQPTSLDMLVHFRANMTEKPVGDAKPGDIVIFRDGQFPFHVGMIADKYGELSLIHAYAGRKKVIEELYLPEWSKLALACFEFIGLEN